MTTHVEARDVVDLGVVSPRRFIEEEREVTREQYEAVNRSMVASCGPKEAR